MDDGAPDEVVDVRLSRFALTDPERSLLQAIVDRNVIDVPAMGRSLGVSDDGVYELLACIAEKLEAFRYLADDRTPPLGTRTAVTRARRNRVLRADSPSS